METTACDQMLAKRMIVENVEIRVKIIYIRVCHMATTWYRPQADQVLGVWYCLIAAHYDRARTSWNDPVSCWVAALTSTLSSQLSAVAVPRHWSWSDFVGWVDSDDQSGRRAVLTEW